MITRVLGTNEAREVQIALCAQAADKWEKPQVASLIQPLRGETRVTVVSLSYFLPPLGRGKQIWMMSFFKTLLRPPFPQPFFSLLLYKKKKEQVCAAFDPSGRKESLKEWWRGSVRGQKTTKRPFLLWLCCYVIPQSALGKWSCLFSVKLKNPYRHNTSRALLSRCVSFFSLDIASANPTPPHHPLDSPPTLPTILYLSASVTLPSI